MLQTYLVHLEHQGEDEEDWAYDEEPAEEKVTANLKGFLFLPQQDGEHVTSSEPREVKIA